MRLNIEFSFDKPVTFTIHHNHIIQAVILRWLSDEKYKQFIHDTGYEYNNRRYKLYTFSRLEGVFKVNKEQKTITYFEKARLTVASAEDKFLEYLLNGFLFGEEVDINGNILKVSSVTAQKKELNLAHHIYTKSPIVEYSTFNTDLSKKTYYYSPFEKEFSELLRKNLINKYNAIYGKEPENSEFKITAIKNNRLKQNWLLYKQIVIKGWSGDFFIEGSKELLNVAYNTGLGAKNSQGFGCFEVTE